MKIGILAWAVRHALQCDFTGTLRALAEQGYQGIHFLGDLFCACLGENVKLNANALWASMGGVDPIRFLSTYLGRSPIVHVGDCNADGEFRDLGVGVVPLPDIMELLKGQVEWVVLDHSNEAGDELPSAGRCIGYLREAGLCEKIHLRRGESPGRMGGIQEG